MLKCKKVFKLKNKLTFLPNLSQAMTAKLFNKYRSYKRSYFNLFLPKNTWNILGFSIMN